MGGLTGDTDFALELLEALLYGLNQLEKVVGQGGDRTIVDTRCSGLVATDVVQRRFDYVGMHFKNRFRSWRRHGRID
jgi:hypothetical protein